MFKYSSFLTFVFVASLALHGVFLGIGNSSPSTENPKPQAQTASAPKVDEPNTSQKKHSVPTQTIILEKQITNQPTTSLPTNPDPSQLTKSPVPNVASPSPSLPADPVTPYPPIENNNEPSLPVAIGDPKSSEATSATPTSPIPQLNLTTSLVLTGGKQERNYSVGYKNGQTAWDQLRLASKDNNFSVKANQSSLGVFVECIAGFCNNPAKGIYWFLYINAQFSKIGASNLVLSPDDQVTWKYRYL